MIGLIKRLCAEEHRHLVPVRSMPVRWNTTYMEIDRGIKLRPVSTCITITDTQC